MSVDAYMNLQLVNTEEFIDDQCQGQLGEVLIRCGPSTSTSSSRHAIRPSYPPDLNA